MIVVIKTGYTSSTQFKAALDSLHSQHHMTKKTAERCHRGGTSFCFTSVSQGVQASGAYVSGQARTGSAVVTNNSPQISVAENKDGYWVGQKFGNLYGSELWGQSNISCWYYTSAGDQPRWQVCGGMKVLRCEYLQSTLRAPRGSAVSLRASSH